MATATTVMSDSEHVEINEEEKEIKMMDENVDGVILKSHLQNGSLNPLLQMHKFQTCETISFPYTINEEATGKSEYSSDLPPNYKGNALYSIQLSKTEGTSMYLWYGFKMPTKPGSKVVFSVWIKFVDTIPPLSDNLGFKHLGAIKNKWINTCKINEWKRISITFISTGNLNEDFEWNLLIFDSIQQAQIIRWVDLEMKFEAVSDANQVINLCNDNDDEFAFNKEFVIGASNGFYNNPDGIFNLSQYKDSKHIRKEAELVTAVLLSKLANRIKIYYSIDTEAIAGMEFDDLLITAGTTLSSSSTSTCTIEISLDTISAESDCSDYLYFKEIAIQQSYFGKVNGCWLGINYMKLTDFNGKEYEIGVKQKNCTITERNLYQKYYDNLFVVKGNKLLFTGILLSTANVIGFQIVDIVNEINDEELLTIFKNNKNNEKQSTIYTVNDKKSILYGNIIGIECEKALETLQIASQYAMTKGSDISLSLEPLFFKLIENCIYSSDLNCIHSIFRIFRFLKYIEYNKDYNPFNLRNDNITNIEHIINGININKHFILSINERNINNINKFKFYSIIKLWKCLYESAFKCKLIFVNKPNFNIFLYTYFNRDKMNIFYSYAVSLTQIFMFFLIIIHLTKEGFDDFSWNGNILSLLLAILITFSVISLVMQQVGETISFYKTFPESAYYQTVIIGYLINIILAICVIIANLFVVTLTDEELDLVLNAVAMLFILELDDQIIDLSPNDENDLYFQYIFNKLRNKLHLYHKEFIQIQETSNDSPSIAKQLFDEYFLNKQWQMSLKNKFNVKLKQNQLKNNNNFISFNDKIDDYMFIWRSNLENGKFNPRLIWGKTGNNIDSIKSFPYKLDGAIVELSYDLPNNIQNRYNGFAKQSVKMTKTKDFSYNCWWGYKRQVPYGSKILCSVWIKFEKDFPFENKNDSGFKIFGTDKCQWTKDCKAGIWKKINVEFISRGEGDANYMLLIFDNLKAGTVFYWTDLALQFSA